MRTVLTSLAGIFLMVLGLPMIHWFTVDPAGLARTMEKMTFGDPMILMWAVWGPTAVGIAILLSALSPMSPGYRRVMGKARRTH